MRLDAQRDREVEKIIGFARRTILTLIWLAICIGAAYFFVNWLLETERLRMSFFYFQLHIPQTVSKGIIVAGTVLVFVMVINFFVLVGYSLVSPSGRRHPGTPSQYSPDPDPDDRKFDYR